MGQQKKTGKEYKKKGPAYTSMKNKSPLYPKQFLDWKSKRAGLLNEFSTVMTDRMQSKIVDQGSSSVKSEVPDDTQEGSEIDTTPKRAPLSTHRPEEVSLSTETPKTTTFTTPPVPTPIDSPEGHKFLKMNPLKDLYSPSLHLPTPIPEDESDDINSNSNNVYIIEESNHTEDDRGDSSRIRTVTNSDTNYEHHIHQYNSYSDSYHNEQRQESYNYKPLFRTCKSYLGHYPPLPPYQPANLYPGNIFKWSANS